MNRRSFLSVLGGAAALAGIDPEKLIWVPGEKKIFIPSERTLQALFRGKSVWVGDVEVTKYLQDLKFSVDDPDHSWLRMELDEACPLKLSLNETIIIHSYSFPDCGFTYRFLGEPM